MTHRGDDRSGGILYLHQPIPCVKDIGVAVLIGDHVPVGVTGRRSRAGDRGDLILGVGRFALRGGAAGEAAPVSLAVEIPRLVRAAALRGGGESIDANHK